MSDDGRWRIVRRAWRLVRGRRPGTALSTLDLRARGEAIVAGERRLLALEGVQVPLRPWLLGRLAGRAWAVAGFGVAKEVAIGEHAVSRRTNSLTCPSQFAAADSRAA